MILTDSHAHLNHGNYARDMKVVLARAAEWGVRQVIVPGYDRATSERAVELAAHTGIAASVGIHPHDAEHLKDDDLNWFRKQIAEGKAVAVGEIGLDYYRDLSPRIIQQEAFRKQIFLAKEVNKPVIIHNRDAGEDVLRILQEESASVVGGVMHCFSEDIEYAKRVLDLGFYIGIAGPVTYKSSAKLQEVAENIPLDRLLIETDAPYLSPQKFRGRRNEPAYVRFVAEMIADLRGLALEEVAAATTENARHLFGLSPDELL